MLKFSSVQSLSRVLLFVTPWIAAHQAALSITNSRSPPKPMSIKSVITSNHFIICCPLLLLSSIFPSIRVFSNESALRIRWPKYWSFSFNISPSNEHSGLISFRWTGWISLQSKGLSRVFSNTTVHHDSVITHLEPDILECEVKWALGSITTNKASGGDGIPVELFQILKDDAVKVLHSICQQMWKTQQWPQDWKRSVFIPIPKKGNAKECSNYCTIALISYTSKGMLKILQARLQQYMNQELSDVQAGFRKGKGTRSQIAKVCWIIGKNKKIPKKHLLLYWLC